MSAHAIFVLYGMAILGFVFVTLVLNRVLGPKPVATAIKLEPFECGATPVDTSNVKAVPIKYYAVAIVFILFDLETVFLFIWALAAQPLTGFMLATFAHLRVPAGADPALRLQGAAARSGDGVDAHPGRRSPSRASAAKSARSNTSRPRRTNWSAGRASSRCSPIRSSPPAARWNSWR
jgi:NADH-quinone oxidoreductase subunit A